VDNENSAVSPRQERGARTREDEVHGILVIGYGNLLRGDDAIGCHAAHALEEHFRDDPHVEVIAAQQLTPEMADDLARNQFVLFLDASCGEEPGTIRQAAVFPEPGPGGVSHHLTPSSLVAAAGQLYGDAPVAMTITMAGWSFELGNKLSPGARNCMAELIRRAKNIIESHRREVRPGLLRE